MSQTFTTDRKFHKFSPHTENVTKNVTQATLTITIITNACQIISMLMILSRLRYVIRLMEWIDDMITDEKIFPPVDDVPFPRYVTNISYVFMYQRTFKADMTFDCVFKTIDIVIIFPFQQFQRCVQEDLPSSV